MARKNAVVTADKNEAGVFVFAAGGQTFEINPADLSAEIYTPSKSADYGLVHKVTLGAAIAKADLPEDEQEAALAKFAGMKAVADRLLAGEWSKRGEGNSQPTGVIFQAFEEWVKNQASKKGVEAPATELVRAKYDAKSRAEQLALRNVPAIAKIIERIKSEAGAAKATAVDTNELLDGLV